MAVAEMKREFDACPINTFMETVNEHGCLRFPGNAFPVLCERFGKDRIVRLCKARAARGNRLHEIRAEVYDGHREAGLVPEGGMNGRYPEDLR